MGHNNYFQFKQFLIRQDKSAMRVGTDGVLLGAWTDVSEVKNILDIGTGTGLIAIMLAQRSNALITGVEIEIRAAGEAKKNAKDSPWPERINILHQKFQEFARQTTDKFDLIVSNPPFFSNSVKNNLNEKSMARHNHLLPFNDLLEGALKLLTANGKLSVILPVNEAIELTKQAKNYDLFISRLLEIKSSPLKEPNRHLMEFTKKQVPVNIKTLSIFEGNNVDYTTEYKQLTADFYLNF